MTHLPPHSQFPYPLPCESTVNSSASFKYRIMRSEHMRLLSQLGKNSSRQDNERLKRVATTLGLRREPILYRIALSAALREATRHEQVGNQAEANHQTALGKVSEKHSNAQGAREQQSMLKAVRTTPLIVICSRSAWARASIACHLPTSSSHDVQGLRHNRSTVKQFSCMVERFAPVRAGLLTRNGSVLQYDAEMQCEV